MKELRPFDNDTRFLKVSYRLIIYFLFIYLFIYLPINLFYRGRISVTVAGLAQSVERLTAEREVAGSIPGAGPLLRVLK